MFTWHLFVIKVSDRDELMKKLKEADIGTSLHLSAHCHPYYQQHYRYDCTRFKNANRVFNEFISIPIFPDLMEEEVEIIIQAILKNVDLL